LIMECMFPTLLERDNIKEEVAKWIQHTTDQINNYKSKLAKYNKSEPVDEELVKNCSQLLKREELRLTKLVNFYVSIRNEKYHKVNYAQKKGLNFGCIYAQGPCIFKLDCKIRNSLLAKYYHDIDMENCHPRIAEQLMSWRIQSIECGILLKVHEWFTDNGYPDLLQEDIIDEVNEVINEIGGPYNYENYTVTLFEKPMPIKDLGDIDVDPNVLPNCDEEKEEPAKSNKLKKGFITFKDPSTHRTAIDGRGHIPYKITKQDEFKKMINDILDQDKNNFFLNEYPHHADDVAHIYSLDFDWNLSDVAIDSIIEVLTECTKDKNCPSYFIARNEESGKVSHLC